MNQQQRNVKSPSIHPATLTTPIFVGAGLALLLISLFLSGVNEPDPAWGKLWIIKPLIVVPVAGAIGGAFYYYMNHVGPLVGIHKTISFMLSILGFVIILWLGTVVGLDGTLWN
jgi:hypothetical protein